MKDKNFSYIIYSLLIILIIILSVNKELYDYIYNTMIYLMSFIFNEDNIEIISDIILWILIYFPLRCLSTFVYPEFVKEDKQKIFMIIVMNLFVVVLSMFLKSLCNEVYIINYLLKYVISMIGSVLTILILSFKK